MPKLYHTGGDGTQHQQEGRQRMRDGRGWVATTNTSFMMEFLSKTVMPGRARLPRIIHVKPYDPDLTEEEEEENIDTSGSTPLGATPTKEAPRATRARSLERLPGEAGPPELGIIGRSRSFERRPPRHSLATPDLAPVFITATTSSFTIASNTLAATHDFEKQKSPVKRRANW